jgi:hypothetical protein
MRTLIAVGGLGLGVAACGPDLSGSEALLRLGLQRDRGAGRLRGGSSGRGREQQHDGPDALRERRGVHGCGGAVLRGERRVRDVRRAPTTPMLRARASTRAAAVRGRCVRGVHAGEPGGVHGRDAHVRRATNTCVPCVAHDQCGGAACNLYSGACLPADRVFDVGGATPDFMSLSEAVASFGAEDGEHAGRAPGDAELRRGGGPGRRAWWRSWPRSSGRGWSRRGGCGRRAWSRSSRWPRARRCWWTGCSCRATRRRRCRAFVSTAAERGSTAAASCRTPAAGCWRRTGRSWCCGTASWAVTTTTPTRWRSTARRRTILYTTLGGGTFNASALSCTAPDARRGSQLHPRNPRRYMATRRGRLPRARHHLQRDREASWQVRATRPVLSDWFMDYTTGGFGLQNEGLDALRRRRPVASRRPADRHRRRPAPRRGRHPRLRRRRRPA